MNCWPAATYKTAWAVASLQGALLDRTGYDCRVQRAVSHLCQHYQCTPGAKDTVGSYCVCAEHSEDSVAGKAGWMNCWENRRCHHGAPLKMRPLTQAGGRRAFHLWWEWACSSPSSWLHSMLPLAGAPQRAAVVFTREGRWIASRPPRVLSSDI